MRIGFRRVPLRLALACAALGFAAPHGARADWPPCGRAISTAPNSQTHAAAATDGAGGAIITWQDHRGAKVNIFAQHVLTTGELVGTNER